MKNQLLILAMLICTNMLAQTNMNIYLNNGTVLQIPLVTIDSITYTNTTAGSLATITTLPTASISSTGAISGGVINNNGGSSITGRGICWSTNSNPTTANTCTYEGSGTGSFNSTLYGLLPNTLYYVRAYAINSAGTAYGNQLTFTTIAGGSGGGNCIGGPSTVVDIDGNVYNVVSIGNQCWMQENLKTTRYKNGALIPTNLTDVQWAATTSGACADYNNDPANTTVYGKLYNWYAVSDPQGLCPTGWHEPEDWEWNVLVKSIDPNADTTCLGCYQSQTAGGAMKEIGLTHWATPNAGATNSSGFTGLPGGYRYYNGPYFLIGYNGYWWSAAQYSTADAYYRNLNYGNSDVNRNYTNKTYGFSVRCVRD